MGTTFKKLRLFFHKVFFIINTLFPPLRVTVYAGRLKLFAGASELFPHAACQLVIVRKNGVLGEHPSGGQKMEVGGC
jgi:hypothetical protein